MPYGSRGHDSSDDLSRDAEDEVFDLELRATDGTLLRGTLREPDGRAPRATIVFAHAMFARRSEWEKPRGFGLAARFAKLGYRTISFDFRAHGDSASGPAKDGGDAYDAFVRHDLPAVVACAKDRGGLVIVVGHSLGGHVALASQGLGALGADALVVAGANVWHRPFEPSRATFLAQSLAARAMGALVRGAGRFPARALRLGSDDASPGALSVFLRTANGGVWRSDDGRDDYFAALTRVDVPVCAILSTGDTFICRPTSGERFLARTRGKKKVILVTRADDGGAPPDHMGLVTTEACRRAWDTAIAWAHEQSTGPSRPTSLGEGAWEEPRGAEARSPGERTPKAPPSTTPDRGDA